MATALYARVSHKSQDTKSQEMDLRTWAKSQDDEVVWYRDHFTGTEMERPGLDRLASKYDTFDHRRVLMLLPEGP